MKELSILGGASESFVMLYDKALLQVDGAGRYDVQCSLDGEHWSVLSPVVAKCEQHSRTIVLDLLAGAQVRVVCVSGTMESARYSFDMSETSEAARIEAEAIREANELARVEAEAIRAEEEAGRILDEGARVRSEAERVSAESGRANAEAARVADENTRKSNEAARKDAEAARVNAEKSRVSAEQGRVSAEAARVSAESARKSAESGRVSAEAARVSAESGRVSAEAARVSAEAAREAAEGVREATFQTNEAARETEFGEAIQAAKDNLVVVNDLTTGGDNKALSAEMGKELGKELDDLNLQVNDHIIEYTFSSTYAWSDEFNEIPIGTLIENIGDLQVKLYESKNAESIYTLLPINQKKYITHAVTVMRSENVLGTAKIITREGLSYRLEVTNKKTDENTQSITELSALVASRVNKAYGKNLIDLSEDITDGEFLDSSGIPHSNASYYITNYIKIEPSTIYYFSINGGYYPAGSNTYWAIYDEKLNVLLTGTTQRIASPENARFIRCTVSKSRKEIMLEKGETRTDYVMGSPIHQYIEHIENDTACIKEGIGNYSSEKSLYLNAGSYVSINDLPILKGDVITSFGGYEGQLLLCPSKKFDPNNIIKYLKVKDLPYIATEDIGSLRPDVAIDNYISYLSKAKGIKGDIEELNNKINAEVKIKPLGSSFKGDISNGDLIVLEKNSIKGEDSFSFCANIETFNKIKIGRGTPYEKLYSSSWLEIDNTNLVIKAFYTESNFKENSYPHGLNITNNIQILINCLNNHKAKVMIVSNGIVFEKEISWNGCNGSIFVESDNTNLKGVVFSWTCKKLDASIWMFGDSYFALNSESRWPYYLINNGYKDILINGFPGASSANGYNDVVSLLKHSTPKYIFWCMGMNNADSETSVNSSWLTIFNQLKGICETNGIELVVSTIPTVKGGYVEDTQEYNKRIHKFKNAIVKDSGLRYVDFEKAVGANEETGEWFGNMLSSDGVHPSADGARCLFMQAISDFPELMSAENY